MCILHIWSVCKGICKIYCIYFGKSFCTFNNFCNYLEELELIVSFTLEYQRALASALSNVCIFVWRIRLSLPVRLIVEFVIDIWVIREVNARACGRVFQFPLKKNSLYILSGSHKVVKNYCARYLWIRIRI